MRHLHEQLGLDLWLVSHADGDELVVVASAGPWEDLMPPGTRVPWATAFCSRMVGRSGPVCAPDVLSVSAYAPLVSGVFGLVRAYVGVPLEGDDGRFFGTLSAVSGTQQSAGVLVLDLNDLKQVNDAGGHAAGDELLALCAEVLQATSRPGDTVARTGGDEFAVLAVECDPVSLRALEVRLRRQLRTAGVRAATGGASRRRGEHLSQTWQRADAAMYQDKRRGRRRGARAASPRP